MSQESLTSIEKEQLLRLARQAIRAAVNRQEAPEIERGAVSPHLYEPGASFVTLTDADGELRGCIGTLEAFQPLVEDVCDHAVAAALEDYRFPQVRPNEVDQLHIEISRLTHPQPLEYNEPADLPRLLRPGIDGVILRDGMQRATFLPQVWEKVRDAEDFLSHLCQKMGASPNLWRRKKLQVLIYEVEEFEEESKE
jgi:AmmeMemoRadiSam system protein A